MRHEPPVRSYAITHPAGRVTLPSQTGWDHLLYAHSGLFRATVRGGAWTVPRGRVLCVATDGAIEVDTPRRTALRCLYLRRNLDAVAPGVRAVDISPLARELLLHAVATAPIALDTPAHLALITLLADEIGRGPTTTPLWLPLPTDPRARRLADLVATTPAAPLAELIATCGASRRTLERRFRSETGLTLAGWQRRARVLAAIESMSDGMTVTATAIEVGYATPSSFVTAFRTELGATPRQFMSSPRI